MAQDKLIKQILKRKDILDLITNAGIAYTGYRASRHWSGALAGLIAYRLAQAPNLPASIAGTATLAALGIAAYSDGSSAYLPPIIEAVQDGTITEKLETSTVMTQAECRERGGTIVSVFGDLCLCSITTTVDPPPATEPRCPDGFEWNPVLEQCVRSQMFP